LSVFKPPVGTTQKKWIERTDKFGIFTKPVLGQLFCWSTSFFVQKTWFKIAEPDLKKREEYIQLTKTLDKQGSLYCLASGIQATNRDDPFVGRKLDCKSALLWGEADSSHRPTKAYSFAEYLVQPCVTSISAGHFPEMSEPDQLLWALKNVC
jgi:hypothetical protein